LKFSLHSENHIWALFLHHPSVKGPELSEGSQTPGSSS
jgi:hypothetical protein